MLPDLRYAFRQLRESPGFTLIAVLTLALGIGANTAIFSVVNAVLLKPLPFPKAEELVAFGVVRERDPGTGASLGSMSYPDFFDYRDQNQSFSAIALFRDRSLSLLGAQETQSVRAQKVTSEFFNVVGVMPMTGRNFAREDEADGGGPGGHKVILSHDFWQRYFDGASTALGSTLTLEGRPHTVIGMMPKSFRVPLQGEPAEVFITIAEDASAERGLALTTERGNHSLQGVARLKPGVSVTQAASDLQRIAADLTAKFPETNTGKSAGVLPLREELVGDLRTGLYTLFGAVICVLLIANANVANLLLARASVRGKEIALRAALGASRARIVRQLLLESALLALIGGGLGLLFAQWGTDSLLALVPQDLPLAANIELDWTVLAFTFLVSLVTGIAFGLVPAWQASQVDLNTALKTGSRGGSGTARKVRMRNALVVVEVALALVLLICAGLLIQSFARLGRVNPGLQTERLLTARIGLPDIAYNSPEKLNAFYAQLLPRLRALPGVEAASAVLPLPLSGSNSSTAFDIEERPLPEGQWAASAVRLADYEYFKTAGIPIREGRGFNASDQFASAPVVIVNESFARKFFPGENVIGKRIKPSMAADERGELMREIVGVVGDVKHRGLEREFTPEIYLPLTQIPPSSPFLVLRTKVSNPGAVTAAVRDELTKLDRNIPLTRVRVFEEYVARALARPRFHAILLSVFAGTALLLTAIGIYGVMAYSVAQRTNEIGIRIALGAAKSNIFRLIVGQAMGLVAISLAIGLVGAFAATRLLNSLLFGVGAADPVTFGAIVIILSFVAFLAAWLPARRATKVDPVIALRAE